VVRLPRRIRWRSTGSRCKIGLGEHVAILGPNGCGKSTLIKTITRECYPLYRDNSSVRILGQESWNVFDLRSLLGNAFSQELDAHLYARRPPDSRWTPAFFSSSAFFTATHVERHT